ncbi:TIM barrel protein [Xenophilus arseniciresistens]|uniref:TIM barrel protein n=1 Tax=Xenophilus arseniciresistens TaxID=1283306 RepID=A0AAE3NDQ4_9BURK|nr:TIM barrel protein [Xenophilus arseniciresistens]MDA7417734.1 TIM barrel protein [Xenophilus arseniciresistens]
MNAPLLQLAANLDWLYGALAPDARLAAAAADGFAGVEMFAPYAHAPAHYAHALRSLGLQLVLINTPFRPDSPGRLGWAAIPGAQTEFRASFAQARAVAEATGCRRIHVMAGFCEGHAPDACQQTLRQNLTHALAAAEVDGLTLNLEPLNRADMPGYLYHLPAQVIAILREFDSPHLRLQFDYYHCAREGLDLRATLAAARDWIGHVQIAGAPDRYEPDLSRDGLLQAVRELPATGYGSWLGCEYRPRGTPAEGLAWAAPLRAEGVIA